MGNRDTQEKKRIQTASITSSGGKSPWDGLEQDKKDGKTMSRLRGKVKKTTVGRKDNLVFVWGSVQIKAANSKTCLVEMMAMRKTTL